MSNLARPLAIGVFALAFAVSAQAAPGRFKASFIWHAWSNDISSGTFEPYATNPWNAVPLGKYGETGKYTINGKTGAYIGVSSWALVQLLGRTLFNTVIGYDTTSTPIYQNPYSNTHRWCKTTPKGTVKVSTTLEVESGTLWAAGQVGAFAKTAIYYSSLWRTGFDNRSVDGRGSVQLTGDARDQSLAEPWVRHPHGAGRPAEDAGAGAGCGAVARRGLRRARADLLGEPPTLSG